MKTSYSAPRKLRRASIKLLAFGGCCVGILLALLFGYYAHKHEIDPVHRLISRVESKIDKTRGGPSLTETLTAKIETTFLQLRGEVYEIPNNDYVNGGAMTTWGKDLLVITHSGEVYFLDPDKGLVKSQITPPENGLRDYAAISKTEKYKDYVHKLSRVRFNDIQFVDVTGLRGLAVSFTYFDVRRECYNTRISWLPIAPDLADIRDLKAGAGDWKMVFDTAPCLPLNATWTALDGMMAGGRVAFSAPSTLYLGSGDYHLDGIHTYDVGIQSDETTYGKIIAIDLITGQSRIISKGHRNLQGLAIDNQGRLWATEHGVRGGDELNLIEEGNNYGWPLRSLGTLYSGLPLPIEGTYGRHDDFEPPVYAWLPSAAVSSLTSLSGIDESWDGDLLAGSLSSPEFGQSLFHIRILDERVVFVERIKIGRRIRYLTQFGPDKIAAWLDTNELVVFSTGRRADPLKQTEELVNARYDGPMAGQVMQVLRGCNECHSFEQFDNKSAPSLNGVMGRKIASTNFDGYSSGLKTVADQWTPGNLGTFLRDPNQFAPGTTMPAAGLSNDTLLEAVIWALEQTDTTDDEDLTYN